MRLLALAITTTVLAGCIEEPRDERLVSERTEANAAVIDGNTAFAVDVYDTLAADEGNLFLSPFSISSALSMTWAGARGTTEAEMATVLHAEGDPDTWHAEFGALTRDLSGDHEGRGYTLHLANKLFGQADYPFEQPFLDINALDYGAPLQEVDYADPEASRQTVNDWVAEQTRDRIDELFKPGVINVDTRLVLANAIYFKADWTDQFDPADTTDGAFTLADGSTVQVPLMSREGELEMGQVDDPAMTVGRLPYQDDEVSMWILLPEQHDGLPGVEAALTPEALEGWTDAVAPVDDAPLILPKFDLRYELSLRQVLSDLGMPTAFEGGQADFTGIADVESEPLFIQDVVHEAFVMVDEEGTEAAAATGVAVGTESATLGLTVDHPFLFLIRDDLTGSILFMGRVVDPS